MDNPAISIADRKSVSYAMGFEAGFKGKPFRDPCAGNPIAANAYYFAFLAGQSHRDGKGQDYTLPLDERCDCQHPEPTSSAGLVSEGCPFHGELTRTI